MYFASQEDICVQQLNVLLTMNKFLPKKTPSCHKKEFVGVFFKIKNLCKVLKESHSLVDKFLPKEENSCGQNKILVRAECVRCPWLLAETPRTGKVSKLPN
jgi:hypothetical protein